MSFVYTQVVVVADWSGLLVVKYKDNLFTMEWYTLMVYIVYLYLTGSVHNVYTCTLNTFGFIQTVSLVVLDFKVSR